MKATMIMNHPQHPIVCICMPHMGADGMWWMLHNIFGNHASSDNSIRHQISPHARCVAIELGGIKREKPSAHAPQSGVTATPSAPFAGVLPKWISLPCNKCLSGE